MSFFINGLRHELKLRLLNKEPQTLLATEQASQQYAAQEVLVASDLTACAMMAAANQPSAKQPASGHTTPAPEVPNKAYKPAQHISTVSQSHTMNGRPTCFLCNHPGHVAAVCKAQMSMPGQSYQGIGPTQQQCFVGPRFQQQSFEQTNCNIAIGLINHNCRQAKQWCQSIM